jgi:hypothetical protein
MGCFDTLIDGETDLQVKCFGGNLNHFKVGEQVPTLHYYEGYQEWEKEKQLDTYTIVNDPWSPRFGIIMNRVFIGFTDDKSRTAPPYVGRWGVLLEESYFTTKDDNDG